MLSLVLVPVILVQVYAVSTSVDERILQYGSNGTAVVLLSVAYVEQSAVFPDDNGLLRRIAYVETRDGTQPSSAFENIWAVSQEALLRTQTSDHSLLNVKRNIIALEFDIDWNEVEWDDLQRPLYSALAARLILFLAPERLPDSSDIPGQAQFWKQHYNTNGSINDFIGRANELEGNVLESTSSEFFIGFARNDADPANPILLTLFITSIEPDPVLVKVESLTGFNFTGIATNNATLTVNIPNLFHITSSAERDKGLRISAGESKIVVYGLNYGMFTSDAFLALPCDRLAVENYEYYGVTYPANHGPGHILIVGCEDNTVFQIGSEVIELSKMETYLWERSNDITGTKIVSNRPLVVYTGHRCTNIPSGVGACDHITEQVPPTAIWGSNFLSASLSGRSSGDIYRMIASENSTNVVVNCSTFNQLQTYDLGLAGSWQEFNTPDESFCSISSTKPLLIMQFSLGNGFDSVGDPFMMMVTPVEQYSNNYIFNVLPEFSTNYITIYVAPDDYDPENIVVNDNDLQSAVWTTVYCTNATICGYITNVILTPGEHRLYHRDVSAHIGVSAYGFNRFNSYGYPGGLELIPVQLATVSFSQSTFMVKENAKVVTIDLVRSGDTSSEVVVLIGSHSYKGSATAGRDYVPILEIVTFATEEMKKRVEIFITDDKNIEYDESFFLYLTSGEGVHLSPFSTAEVVIKNDDGQIFLKPRYGSELGGTPVVVSGTNLTVAEDDNVTCIFNDNEMEGFVINEKEVLCVSPEMTITGRVPFELRIAGENSSFTGISIFISLVHDIASEVKFESKDPVISSGSVVKLRWSPQDILPIEIAEDYTVDITLREYNSTSQQWVFTDIATDVPNTGYAKVVTPTFVSSENYNDLVTSGVIQIGISKSTIEEQNRKRSLSSKFILKAIGKTVRKFTIKLVVIKLIKDVVFRLGCEAWTLSQSRDKTQQIMATLPTCPCTESEIREKRGTYKDSKEDLGEFLDGLLRNFFHPGSSSCFRQRNTSGPGQQCCYNSTGHIIVGPPGGGTVDFIAPTDFLNFTKHIGVDVLPFLLCCKAGFLNNCARYYEFRPSANCPRICPPPPPAFARGDPHLVTLDGFKYTFNGHGEYTLIETADNSFTLQGRMTQASGTNESAVAATVFSAIVGKDNNSDTVQFETDKNGTLTAIVEDELVVFDILEQEFKEVVIKHLGNNSIEALFDSGIYIQAKGENGFISFLQVVVPEKFKGNVNGLLGNFNGNVSDDLWPKFGAEPLSVDDSEEDIHNKFGITWIVDSARKSLFFYQPEESWDTFYDPFFHPSYKPNFTNPELELEANEICGDDVFCLFDIAVTGIKEVGIATHESSQLIEEINTYSIPVVCEPPCDNGACIANNTCKCAEGYTGKTCSEIVILPCEEEICQNGGNCTKHVTDYSCDCPTGFSGYLCEETEFDAIEVGDIVDTVVCNPLYSVSLDIQGEDSDSNLCYEVHGTSGTVFNLVSDKCFSINARYNEINGTSGRYNKIDDLIIRASDAANNCVDIIIYSEDTCKSAFVRTGNSFEEISTQFRQNGIQIDFIEGHIEVLLPCKSYPGGGIRVIVTCFSECTSEILSVKNLALEFNRAKLPELTNPLPHGLLGQFWHPNFTRETFTRNGAIQDNAFIVTTPSELGPNSFVSLFYHLTWDFRDEGCLYAGTRQAGATRYATSPADSVIEGEYTDYKVLHHFGTEYAFSVFSYEEYGCPAFPSIPIRSSE